MSVAFHGHSASSWALSIAGLLKSILLLLALLDGNDRPLFMVTPNQSPQSDLTRSGFEMSVQNGTFPDGEKRIKHAVPCLSLGPGVFTQDLTVSNLNYDLLSYN